MAQLNTPNAGRDERRSNDQLNAQPRAYGLLGGKLPDDLKSGDSTTRLSADGKTMRLGISDGKRTREISIPSNLPALVGLTTSTSAPSLVEFPDDGDWHWHFNSTAGTYSIARNVGGTIVYPAFTSALLGTAPTGYANITNGSTTRNASGLDATGATGPAVIADAAKLADFKLLLNFVYTMARDLGVGGSNHHLLIP